jgi:hypothetical protein
MRYTQKNYCSIACLAVVALLVTVSQLFAGNMKGFKGWEADSEYNKLYNAKELDKLTGEITKFLEVTPLPGMDRGTAFLLAEGTGESIIVHLCPASFAGWQETGLQKGIKTKVKGSWAVIGDKDVFMAAKVKQGDHFEFKVRLTKDGTPFWTLSPEEADKEKETD